MNFKNDNLPDSHITSISSLANQLYNDITQNGIDGIRFLFSKGKSLSQELRFDKKEEYLKKMIMAQMNIGRMLLTHKYHDSGFDERQSFNKEADWLREQINVDEILKFDDYTLEALFGNSLGIESEEEYEEWRSFVYNDRTFDSIYLEEEFKFCHEHENNPLKKFIQSFRYRKMLRKEAIEDSYINKVRQMIRNEIASNSDNTWVAHIRTHSALEKGVEEYESIRDVEDIARMTLMSLTTKQGEPVNIETVCHTVRNEMKNTIGATRIGTEYRERQVTLGSETGISKRPIIYTIPFEDVPEAIKNLQAEYEKAYNEEENQEEYIRKIAKIYADFIYIQPYEDGNKRTATCLLNSMLLSKGIIPPPISLANDVQMAEAFYKVQNNDYEMLQDVIVERSKTMNLDNSDVGGREEKIKEGEENEK